MAYSRLLKRRVRSPYLDIINAQAPYLRESARLKEQTALQEKGLTLQEKGLGLRERELTLQDQRARNRLVQEREMMELQEKQAKQAFGINVAQLGTLGGYTGYKLLGGGAKALPAITGTGGLSAASSSTMALNAPEALSLPVRTKLGADIAAGGLPATIAPGATTTTGGTAGTTGATALSGGVPTLSSLTTPAMGASMSPLGAAATVAGIEMGHKMLKPMIPKIAGRMPGGESEWKHGMKIATRAGQGAAVGAAFTPLGAPAGAVIGTGIGAVETAWPAIKTAAEDIGHEAERTGEKIFKEVSRPVEQIGNIFWGSGGGGGLFGGGGFLGTGVDCIIITAATNPHSYEVNVTREYRDRFLSQQTLRGYYMIAEQIVPLMHKSKLFKWFIKKYLVDHIVKHCEWGIGKRKKKPVKSSFITTMFLGFCDFIGSTVPTFTRLNGEVW